MEVPSPEPSVLVNNYFHDRSVKMAEIHDVFSAYPTLPGTKKKHAEHEQREKSSRDFLTELDRFNRYLDHISGQVPVDFDVKNCEWAKVIAKLMEAKSAVSQRLERDKTWLSKGGVVLTKMSAMFQPALQAIPDELCILHGGLALVLHLAKGRDRIKGDIVNTFEDLTYTFAAAGNAVEFTNSDHRLNVALDGLRLTLLETIPPLIHILNPKNFVNHLAAPFRTAQAERLLDTIRLDIKRVQQRATALTDRLHSRAAQKTEDHMESIHESVRDLHAMQQDIRDMVNDALAGQDGLAKMLSDAVKVFNHHRRERSIRVKDESRLNHTDEEYTEMHSSKLSTLLWILHADPGHVAKDLLFTKRQTREFDTRSRHTAAAIFSHPNFQRWMTADSSDLLHIEGRLDGTYGRTSPISYFCATLADKMNNMPPQAHTFAISFFCGQHLTSDDPLRGPRGLLRSLIDQSLRAWDNVSLEGLDLDALERASHHAISTDDLCGLLHFVMGQVPLSYTVYCIIDDINQLEREDWADDFWVLMKALEEMVSDQKTKQKHTRFKTIITSPGRSYWLRGDQAVNVNNHILVSDA